MVSENEERKPEQSIYTHTLFFLIQSKLFELSETKERPNEIYDTQETATRVNYHHLTPGQ